MERTAFDAFFLVQEKPFLARRALTRLALIAGRPTLDEARIAFSNALNPKAIGCRSILILILGECFKCLNQVVIGAIHAFIFTRSEAL